MSVREKLRPVASYTLPDWGRTHNPAMCPDQELNLYLFGAQDEASTNTATQPGKSLVYLTILLVMTLMKFVSITLATFAHFLSKLSEISVHHPGLVKLAMILVFLCFGMDCSLNLNSVCEELFW